MSLEAKLILSACVLAVILPLWFGVVRRSLRGERFAKTAKVPLTPPTGPPLGGGGT